MYFFLCILAMLDMGYVSTTMPQMLVHLLAHSHTISFAGCWIQMYAFGALAATESMLFVVMAYDRINHYFCEGPSVLSLACIDTHIIDIVDQILIVLMCLIPISLIVASYVHIAKAILKIKSTQARCKAFSTCASHLTVVTFFYGPSSYIYMRPNSSYSPERDKQISLFYNSFTALLNPLVYSLRNKDIKRAFLKVMKHGRR
ncbi:hypothetical protein U0070_021431 [Myodes glareolus]|uniref:G-protein coupled receptors family 1 profile domain-containing protein n=1 Tax=Myodes glareolus TaxID=447135 RepID=A0AAW0H381_MYOGA